MIEMRRGEAAASEKKLSHEENWKRIKDGFVPSNDINTDIQTSRKKFVVASQAYGSLATQPSPARLSLLSCLKGKDRNSCKSPFTNLRKTTVNRESHPPVNDQKRQRFVQSVNKNEKIDSNHNGSTPQIKRQNSEEELNSKPPPPFRSIQSSLDPLYTQKLDSFLEEYEIKYGLEPLDNQQVQLNLPKSWLPLITSLKNGPYRKITAEILKNFGILTKSQDLPTSKEEVSSLNATRVTVHSERGDCNRDCFRESTQTLRKNQSDNKGKVITFASPIETPITDTIKNKADSARVNSSKTEEHLYRNTVVNEEKVCNNNQVFDTIYTEEKPRLLRSRTWTKTQSTNTNTEGMAEADRGYNNISSCSNEYGNKPSKSTGNLLPPQLQEQNKRKQQPLARQFTVKSVGAIGIKEGNKKSFLTPPESCTSISSPSSSSSFSPKIFKYQRPPCSSASAAKLKSRIPVAIYYFKHDYENMKENNETLSSSRSKVIRKKSSRIPVPLPKIKSKPVKKSDKTEVNSNKNANAKVKKRSTSTSSVRSSCSGGIRKEDNNKSGRNDRNNEEQQVHEAKAAKSSSSSAGIGVAEVVAITPTLLLKNNKLSLKQPMLTPLASHQQKSRVPESAPELLHRNDDNSNKVNKVFPPLKSKSHPLNIMPQRGGGDTDEVSECLDLIDGLCGHTSWIIKKVLEMPESEKDAADRFKKLKENPEIGDFFGAPYVKKEVLGHIFFSGGCTGSSRCTPGSSDLNMFT